MNKKSSTISIILITSIMFILFALLYGVITFTILMLVGISVIIYLIFLILNISSF